MPDHTQPPPIPPVSHAPPPSVPRLKASTITYGEHVFGDFVASLQSCVHDERRAEDVEFFTVLLRERRHLGIEPPPPFVDFYVDIVTDPRFDWWGHLGKFERRLVVEDVVEYNARCADVLHKISMPTFKLARLSILRLERLCLDVTKAARKKKAS